MLGEAGGPAAHGASQQCWLDGRALGGSQAPYQPPGNLIIRGQPGADRQPGYTGFPVWLSTAARTPSQTPPRRGYGEAPPDPGWQDCVHGALQRPMDRL